MFFNINTICEFGIASFTNSVTALKISFSISS